MSKVIRTLLWKEWHEQRWKLLFGCVILTAYTAIGLKTRLLPDEGIILFGVLVGILLLPIFVSMGLVATERAEGSMTTLLALPVHPWVVFAIKTVIGATACVLPMLSAAVVALLMAGSREMPAPRILIIYSISTALSIIVLTWMLACGVRQPTEARAGLVSIGIIVVFAVWAILSEVSALLKWIWFFHPFQLWNLMEGGGSWPGLDIILIQGFWIMILWLLAAWRFAKPGRTRA